MRADRTSHDSRQAFGPAAGDRVASGAGAILYIARTGCQWRMLPKESPPFTTVQGYFYDWRDNSLFETINFTLLLQAREAAGREASPTAGVNCRGYRRQGSLPKFCHRCAQRYRLSSGTDCWVTEAKPCRENVMLQSMQHETSEADTLNWCLLFDVGLSTTAATSLKLSQMMLDHRGYSYMLQRSPSSKEEVPRSLG
jgi:transposase